MRWDFLSADFSSLFSVFVHSVPVLHGCDQHVEDRNSACRARDVLSEFNGLKNNFGRRRIPTKKPGVNGNETRREHEYVF